MVEAGDKMEEGLVKEKAGHQNDYHSRQNGRCASYPYNIRLPVYLQARTGK